jgi:hypothetical protein
MKKKTSRFWFLINIHMIVVVIIKTKENNMTTQHLKNILFCFYIGNET